MAPTPHGRVPETIEAHPGTWLPETDQERAAVRDQLYRVIKSPLFVNSKRCAGLLKFVVEFALNGRTEHLKERTLGIDVFQREPDYDTNRDPVVRTTAVEIRKRIAQYYTAPEHENEIRIGFPAGSYVPEFRMPAGWSPPRVINTVPLDVPRSKPRGMLTWIAACAVVLVAAVVLWSYPKTADTEFDRFWRPVINSSGPILLLIGGAAPFDAPATANPVSIRELQQSERVAFADASTLSRITGVMMMKGKPFHIRRHQEVKLEDLREGPVVLIGAFNNDWTIRLADQIRFRFVRKPETRVTYIEDRQNPSAHWLVDQDTAYRSLSEDYALVSRVLDPTTGRLVVTAAGITKFGTAAAGEFLSEPSYMEQALKSAPRDWDRKNLQILISTKLVGESSGPPRVVASYFW